MSKQIITDKIPLDDLIDSVQDIVGIHGKRRQDVIPILHAIQSKYNYLPKAALQSVCDLTEITPADIQGVSTFYTQFRHEPVGDHIIQVCTGTACHVKGAERVHDAFKRTLNIADNLDTDPDGLFTLQRVACLGCCTLAPVIQIDGSTYGHVSTDSVSDILDDFLTSSGKSASQATDHSLKTNEKGEIRIGLGSCCIASGSEDVQKALEATLTETGIQTRIKRVGCVGMCHRVPLLEINSPQKEAVLYDRVTPQQVKNIVLSHFQPESWYKRLSNRTMQLFEKWIDENEENGFSRHPLHIRDPRLSVFLDKQRHIATEHAGILDPLDLEEYRSGDGFSALERLLNDRTRDDIIQTVERSGLRGRGGAGFPTGKKWSIAKKVNAVKKYIICNGDEGDPGAFMDRMILESYPYRVIEGMIIAGYAIGADEGFLYIRAEYPLAVKRVTEAIKRCEEAGILGEHIFGSDYSLRLKIMEGAGAFVCGEETALLASIEGRRGMPSFRPPYPVEKGLWGYPTLVNNCETYATVPWIMRNGAEQFAMLGTGKSKGTKVFSLAGKVKRGGLIEVPMGITIREIVEVIGGGIEGDKAFKAVQIGGPSGGCIPAELSDTKVDFEDLLEAGAMMGSGGLLVMDETDCMVEIARYFLSFTCNQSCGKCTHCRIGTRHMLDILERLCTGNAQKNDLEKLEELALQTQHGSLCGLGKTAPNPVLTTLRYFRPEYEAHLKGVCPAKSCKHLIQYTINENCIGCTICAQKCPADAIPFRPYEKHEIIQEVCIKCDTCLQVCPHDAVEVK